MGNLSSGVRVRSHLFVAVVFMAGMLVPAGPGLVRSAHAQSPGDALEKGFVSPPEAAWPRTWWHWTGSNITLDGITKDLEWMKRAGIGGFQLADVNFGMGQTVDEKIVFWTPAWLGAVRHAATEADRLGLEMTLFTSAGWSLTGGPWVKPEQAMKKLVWSETNVRGPRAFAGKLPQPPSNNGPIRNLSTGSRNDPTYYGESAVIAFLTPSDERDAPEMKPVVTTNAGAIDGAPLLDDDLNSALTVAAPGDGSPAYVQFAFAQPFQARAITLAGPRGIPVGRVSASQDGRHFQTLVSLPGAQLYRQGRVRTFSFPVTTARFFRIEMTGAPLGPAETMSQAPARPDSAYTLTEAVLHGGARVHRWEDKAGFSFLFEYESVPTPEVAAGATIPRTGVVDLTGKMDADGTLHWQVPPGRWTILRMGYSLTGAKNRPPVPAGLGYEVDKLSARHTRDYFRSYTGPIAQTLGPLYGKSLRYMLLDSWEAGMQNWTDEMLSEFRKRRGYDPTPYLPVLAGRIVESAEVSDRFLWDFRRTLVDMFAENHYAVANTFLHEQGLGTYSEAAGVSLEVIEDALLYKKQVDIPMGEFWVRDLHPSAMYYQDVRGAASAAHVYGKPIAAAEAFTGGGYESPSTLKQIGDYWFAQGINRFVFHTSAHQPLDTKPGNTMVGTHLNRNITWAEQARPFMTYLARNAFMLQQGRFVADLAYLLNEGAPSTMPFWGAGLQPAPPEGYDFDYVNADVVLSRMSVDAGGRIVLPDGMSYRVLVLPQIDRMTVPVLRKIRDLVRDGATVVGPRPTGSPSLSGADSTVQALADEVWGDLDGASRTSRVYGKGRVVWGQPLKDVLTMLETPPDVEYAKGLDTELAWIHRRTGEADVYFVANRSDRAQDVDVRFRVSGREAERWQPDTGAIEPAAYRIADGRTTVPLSLAPREAVFVVFRRNASSAARTLPRPVRTRLVALDGPWDVRFPSSTIRFEGLASWTEHPADSVKYFSGTATYMRTLQAPQDWFKPGTKLLLDLGNVKDLAEVRVNGVAVDTLWKAPFEVDVTRALKPGENRLEIAVTNEWTNQLAGRSTGRPGPPMKPAESGLLGPVQVLSVTMPPPAGGAQRDVVAGIPVNYDEAKTGSYTLPDPLVLSNGKPVRDAATWLRKRRPEIVRLFEENQFGRTPDRPADLHFDVFDRGTPAFGGKAIRKQVTIYFTKGTTGPKMDLLIYLPAGASGPVPLLLNPSFMPNVSRVNDPGVRQGEMWGRDQKKVPAPPNIAFDRLDVEPFVAQGFGIATVYYGDIDPDFQGGVPLGVRALYLKAGQTEPAPDEWGAISAWSWGLSRAMDYFETDPNVDAKRIALLGVSRLGKTVLWTGARDPRFAMVIASCSGEGGAALSRRNYGETIAHLTEPTRYPYQFAANYAKYGKRVDEFPVDANLLVALIAPRPLLLQTGTEDGWSDPKGEFLAAVVASPVYELLGAQGLGTDQMPGAGQPVLNTLGYFMHQGGHGTLPSDWEVFRQFMQVHLREER